MFKKVAFVLLLVLVVGLTASALVVWRFPLAVFNWGNRRSLRNTGFVESTVPTEVGSQAIFTKGSGEPLIMLHGAGDHAGSWVKVADMFTSRHRVILVDLAGHGNSEPGGTVDDGPLFLGTILQGLEGVLDREAPGKQVTIVGNSLGGWMAMVYSQRHPERVQRIVLVDGGAIRGERQDLVTLPTNRAQARKLFDSVIDARSPRPADFVLDDVVRQSQRGPIGRIVKGGVEDMERYLLDGHLEEFNTPVDLLWGESDELIPLSYAKRLESQLPAARLKTLPRCGHIPQQECPHAFSKALQEILDTPAPLQKAPLPPAPALSRGTKT